MYNIRLCFSLSIEHHSVYTRTYITCMYTTTVDKAGDTPLSLANKHGHWEVVKYLAQEHQCYLKCVCCKLLTFSECPQFACIHAQLQWMRLETLLSPFSVLVVTWIWSRLSSTSMLIQIVSVYQCCYVVDGGLPHAEPANKAGDTPLSLAYKHGHWEVVKYLAQEHQCDPKCVCCKLLTFSECLQFACIHSCSEWDWRHSSLSWVFPWWPGDGHGSHQQACWSK